MVLIPFYQALRLMVSDAEDAFWDFTARCSIVIQDILKTSTLMIEYTHMDFTRSKSTVHELLGGYLGNGLLVDPASLTFGYGNVTQQVDSQRGTHYDWHGTSHSSVTYAKTGVNKLDLATVRNTDDANYKSVLRGYTGQGAIDWVTITHSSFQPFNDYVCIAVAFMAALNTKGRTEARDSYLLRQSIKDNAHATREILKQQNAARLAAEQAAAARAREEKRLRRANASAVVSQTAEEPEEVQGP